MTRLGSTITTLRLSSSWSQWKRPSTPRIKKKRGYSREDTHRFYFDIRGIVYRKFVPQGKILDLDFYCHILKLLRVDIRWKRPDQWNVKNENLQGAKAHWHQKFITRVLLAKNTIALFAWFNTCGLTPTDLHLPPPPKKKHAVQR